MKNRNKLHTSKEKIVMHRFFGLPVLLWLSLLSLSSHAQTMQLATTSDDYEITNVASDVDDFHFTIEIDAPLAAGVYDNPPLLSVIYGVSGILMDGTPSDFEAFTLNREISGEEFYSQGSSLQFEIAASAVLDDGVQITELSGSEFVLRFDGREIDNGRFHPALLELRADGTGRIQNSNNTPTLEPLLEVDFGAEYINDLVFDPGNTTLITSTSEDSSSDDSNSGSDDCGGALTILGLLILLYLFCLQSHIRQTLQHIN